MARNSATPFITVQTKSEYASDTTLKKKMLRAAPNATIRRVRTLALYAADAPISARHIERLRERLTQALTEEGTENRIAIANAPDWAFVVGFLPGVTDNVGKTVSGMLRDIAGKKAASVFSSVCYMIDGSCTEGDIQAIAASFHNPVIQYARVMKGSALASFVPIVPRVALHHGKGVSVVRLSRMNDEELAVLGKKGIQNADGTYRGPLALSIQDLTAIRAYFVSEKREPTDVELESIAQTWSEHCKHTIFSDPLDEISEGIYRRYIKGATKHIRAQKKKKDLCVSVFSDNAGAIAFTDTHLITHKVETHNSPSALDPFGGAMTGIVGVNRDTLGFGLGAKPIANVYGFCVGHPHDTRTFYRGENKTNQLLGSSFILDGVVRGVGSGGNESGIPTPVGFVTADSRYRGKPLVFAGTVGLIPRVKGKKKMYEKSARPGDCIVVAGGRVGLDGIHGATFSSEALESGSPATAVQIGDPITQKKLTDAMLMELRDAGLYTSVTDNGAGGISCSVAEMARECGGCTVKLDTVPTKYPGLAPWEVWISESQERMTFAVPKKHLKRFQMIMKKYDVESTHIGTFTKSGRCVVTVGAKKVMDVSLSFLHDGRIPRTQQSEVPALPPAQTHAALFTTPIKTALLRVLSRVGVGSFAAITTQYDHEVQASSVTKPLQGFGRVNAESAVIQPIRGEKKGVVLSSSIRFSRTPRDAYAFSALAIDEAIRAALAAGASLSTIALLDNFCWSSSTLATRLWELKESTRACYETACAFLTPFISGKDSMFNDFRGYTEAGEKVHIAAPPTLLISAIGHITDTARAQTLDLKQPGDVIYVLGETNGALAGSEYVAEITGAVDMVFESCAVPDVQPKKYLKTYTAVEKVISKGLVSAVIPVTKGGLITALAKMSIAGKRGCDVRMHVPGRAQDPHTVLFSEEGGRFLVSVPARHEKQFAAVCGSIPHARIGTVTDGGEMVLTIGTTTEHIPLSTMSAAYHNTPTV